jgi:hypothetical protein
MSFRVTWMHDIVRSSATLVGRLVVASGTDLERRCSACKHAVDSGLHYNLGRFCSFLRIRIVGFFKVAFGRKEKKRKREINCTGYYATFMYITGHLQLAAVYVPEMLCHQTAAVL